MGKKGGLGVRLATALGKKKSFIVHHCSAHRDQLVFQKSMEEHSDFVQLEKEANALYRFYHMSHKRLGDLVDFMAENNFVPRALVKIFKVRWVSSHR